MKSSLLIVATTLVGTISAQAQQNQLHTQVPISAPRQTAFNRQLTDSVAEVLKIADSLKPGMTRFDVLKQFAEEGGLSTRTQHTYVYRGCPYIKITVKFSPDPGTESRSEELPQDKIVEVSEPFLAWGAND
jgi:hypothetical protein